MESDGGGRNSREYARMTRAPEKIPPTPIPAIARPTISALLVGADPQIREPSSKSPMAIRNVDLTYIITTACQRTRHLNHPATPNILREIKKKKKKNPIIKKPTLKPLYTLPNVGCNADVVRKYALPYQPISLILLK
jgi:hypothetical protein